MTYRKVPDENIRHNWIDTQGVVHSVTPDYYENNGTPVDGEADADMAYHNTEVDDPRLDLIAEIAKTSDLFYTPETKAKADQWLTGMVPVMPTGVSFMVGYNYAMHTIKRALEAEDVDELRAILTAEAPTAEDADKPFIMEQNNG